MITATTQFSPDFISPPGETLQDLIDERSMSQAQLAERMGRPVKTINEIIKGKAAITPETSLQLERVLGMPSSFWLIREQNPAFNGVPSGWLRPIRRRSGSHSSLKAIRVQLRPGCGRESWMQLESCVTTSICLGSRKL